MEATRDGLWDWNLLTDSCYFSPGYFLMLGYEDGAFSKEINSWTALLHPEDREAALKANEDCREGRCQSFEVEFRLKNTQEAWQWILSRGKSVVFDGYGRALRMVGTHVDITERKQTEEALRRSSEIQADPTGERRFVVVGRKGLRSGF